MLVIGAATVVAGPEGGKLEAFEKNATTPVEKRSRHNHDDGWESDLGAGLVEVVTYVAIETGKASWERVALHGGGPRALTPRKPGEPLLPTLRLDAAYRAVESDVDAVEERFEAGYGPWAVHLDSSQFKERHPSTRLELYGAYGHYRMSFGSQIEVDFGVGAMIISGSRTEAKPSVSLPVLVHPHKNIGLELRSAWSESVSDFDVGVLFTWHYASVKAGYRWVFAPDQSLNGPYLGFSIRY